MSHAERVGSWPPPVTRGESIEGPSLRVSEGARLGPIAAGHCSAAVEDHIHLSWTWHDVSNCIGENAADLPCRTCFR